jgi:hypothetical protein
MRRTGRWTVAGVTSAHCCGAKMKTANTRTQRIAATRSARYALRLVQQRYLKPTSGGGQFGGGFLSLMLTTLNDVSRIIRVRVVSQR